MLTLEFVNGSNFIETRMNQQVILYKRLSNFNNKSFKFL